MVEREDEIERRLSVPFLARSDGDHDLDEILEEDVKRRSH